MPIFLLLGWLVGVILASILGISALVVFGIPIASILAAFLATPLAIIGGVIGALATAIGPILGPLAALIGGITSIILLVLLALVIVLAAYLVVYLLAYAIATAAITPLLPGLTGLPVPPPPMFPLPSPIGTPGMTPVTIPATPGEFFARGMMIGFNAGVNFILLMLLLPLDPRWVPIVATWSFMVISLSMVLFVARNRIYQGFLGWSAWLFPVSYVATFVGLLLFLFNTIASIITRNASFGVAPDFTTGVIESSNGVLIGMSSFEGGFSLGNFTFLMDQPTTPIVVPPATFVAPSVSSHETGHSLNTAAFGGVILWINAIDQNVAPFARHNLAYGELAAEGHSRAMPGTPSADYAIRIWF